MNEIQTQAEDGRLSVRLSGAIGIEQAVELHRAFLGGTGSISIDASALDRADASVLQILAAAARGRGATLSAGSQGLSNSWTRYGVDDPFKPASP